MNGEGRERRGGSTEQGGGGCHPEGSLGQTGKG